MKITLHCPLCSKKNDVARTTKVVTFNDDGVFELECQFGHRSFIIFGNQKFEVLFEIGIFAIRDGYFREAVSSFTASLERFQEFFINVILFEKDLDINQVQESWKMVSNQSERQLGGYIYTYLMAFNEKPQLLDKKKVKKKSCIEFRNAVIHKGTIPTEEEAIQYGQHVLDIIVPVIDRLQTSYSNGVEKCIIKKRERAQALVEANHNVTFSDIITSLSVKDSWIMLEEPSLKKYLQRVKNNS